MLHCNAWLFPGNCMDRTEVVDFQRFFELEFPTRLAGL
jgi:hypothetical protein